MFFDDVFENADKGLLGGRTGTSNQETEWLIERCTFRDMSMAGYSIEGDIAGDSWVFWSTFDHCNYGVANGVWGGQDAFALYHNNFIGSAVADIWTEPHFVIIKDNVSIGSNQFLHDDSAGNNSTQMYVAGNRILDTLTAAAIESGGCGPLTLVDNVIRSARGTIGPVVVVDSGCHDMVGASLIAIGNRYTVGAAEQVMDSTPRLLSIGSTMVDYSTIDGTLPVLPGTPPHRDRKIIELAPDATAADIQGAIDSTVVLAGQRPVVHFGAGDYMIDSTLTVPPNLDVQLVGDGLDTQLFWTAAAPDRLVQLAAPNKARLQDLYLRGETSSDPIYIASEDSPSSRVQAEMIISNLGAGPFGVIVEGLNNTRVSFYGATVAAGTKSVFSVVGPGTAGTPGGVACFGCLTSAPDTAGATSDAYHVSNGGNLAVFGGWFQAVATPMVLVNEVGESGALSLVGGDTQVNAAAGQPIVNLDGFQGSFTIASYMLAPGALRVANATALTNALVAGCLAYARTTAAELWAGPYAGAGNEAMVGTFQYVSPTGATYYADQAQGVSLPLSPSFVDQMLALPRGASPVPNTVLLPGVSDVQLSRIMIDGGTNSAIHIAR
jgi:hypothetical protein